MLSGKWESQLYNDINPLITNLFMDAANGKYHDENRVITRQDFESQKDVDAYIKYIWSFGNNGTRIFMAVETWKMQNVKLVE